MHKGYVVVGAISIAMQNMKNMENMENMQNMQNTKTVRVQHITLFLSSEFQRLQ